MEVKEKNLEIIDRIGRTEDKLVEILFAIQYEKHSNYISAEELRMVSKELNVPLSKVHGVASFYSMLSTTKRGKHVIQICNSAPCYLNGGKEIVKIFKDILDIDIGEVTEDGLFSMEFTSCIGACDVAPAAKIDNKVYGNLDRGKIIDILGDIRRGEK